MNAPWAAAELREAARHLPDSEARLALAVAERLAPGGWSLLREESPDHLTTSCLLTSPLSRAGLGAPGRSLVLVHHPGSGQFRQVGGHIDSDDPGLRAAALRELAEEAGVEAAARATVSAHPIAVREFAVGAPRCARHVDLLYAAACPVTAQLAGEGRAHWADVCDLPAGTAPDLRMQLRDLLSRSDRTLPRQSAHLR